MAAGQAAAAVAGRMTAEVVVVASQGLGGIDAAGQQVSEDVASEVGQVASSTDRALQTGRAGRMLVAAGWAEPGGGILLTRPPPHRSCDRVVAVGEARRAIGEDVGGHQATGGARHGAQRPHEVPHAAHRTHRTTHIMSGSPVL